MSQLLVVDDDPDFRAAMRAMLGSEGYDVVDSPDATDALSTLDRIRPQAIFLDVVMPGMRGDELLTLLRQRPELDGVPVIVVSASHQADGALDGAAAVLAKPVSREALVATLLRIAERSRERADDPRTTTEGEIARGRLSVHAMMLFVLGALTALFLSGGRGAALPSATPAGPFTGMIAAVGLFGLGWTVKWSHLGERRLAWLSRFALVAGYAAWGLALVANLAVASVAATDHLTVAEVCRLLFLPLVGAPLVLLAGLWGLGLRRGAAPISRAAVSREESEGW